MTQWTFNCKICGWENLPEQHAGAVDCIRQYRALVDELRGLLPQGKQVMNAPLDRDTTARLWIEGESTSDGLDRLIRYIQFMKEAWFPISLPLNEPERETEIVQD